MKLGAKAGDLVNPVRSVDARRFEKFTPEVAFQLGESQPHRASYGYPIYPEHWADHRLDSPDRETVLSHWENPGQTAFYVHVPFCEGLCTFCKFPAVVGDDSQRDRYVNAVLQEVGMYVPALSNATFSGFDIGGGTPTTLDTTQLTRLVEGCMIAFPKLEFVTGRSVETTPKMAHHNVARLTLMRRLGWDRVSMGIQTINSRILRNINRGDNNSNVVMRATESCREAGFKSVNTDLVYGLPGQTLENWLSTVEFTCGLDIDHVSLFRMLFVQTALDSREGDVTYSTYREFYRKAVSMLTDSGFKGYNGGHYFTRASAKPDELLPGNSGYMVGRVLRGAPYLGVGAGAHSIYPKGMSFNEGRRGDPIGSYLGAVEQGELPIKDFYELPVSESLARCIILALYYGVVNLKAIGEQMNIDALAYFDDEIAYLGREGLASLSEKGVLTLTEKGAKSIHGIIALFSSPATQHYLQSLDE